MFHSNALFFFKVFLNSGFQRTLCGGQWAALSGNSYLASTGRLGCCAPGTFMSSPNAYPFSQADSCSDVCPTGKYGLGENDETSADLISCLECAVGKYINKTGVDVCKICTSGQYQEEKGQVSCKECKVGTYLSDPGSFDLLHGSEFSCQTCLGSSCKCTFDEQVWAFLTNEFSSSFPFSSTIFFFHL